MKRGCPQTLIQQYSMEFWSIRDYKVRVAILRSWALAVDRMITEQRIAGSKKRLRIVRKFFLAAYSIADWRFLNDRSGSLGTIRGAFVRCAGLVGKAPSTRNGGLR